MMKNAVGLIFKQPTGGFGCDVFRVVRGVYFYIHLILIVFFC
jgi:hypothetical protein